MENYIRTMVLVDLAIELSSYRHARECPLCTCYAGNIINCTPSTLKGPSLDDKLCGHST